MLATLDLAPAAEEEMLALESIFPDTLHLYSNNDGSLLLSPDLGPQQPPLVIQCEDPLSIAKLTSLPPASLFFRLPPGYPSAPTIDEAMPELKVECAWATADQVNMMLAAATMAAFQAVTDRSVALFEAHAAATAVLDDVVGSLPSPWPVPAPVFDVLIRHNREQTRATLQRSIYSCMICLETKPGKDAVAVPGCAHVFCRQCLHDFFVVLIDENMPKSVVCPHPDCVRTSRTSSKADHDPPPPPPQVGVEGDSDMQSVLAHHPLPPDFVDKVVGPDRTEKWKQQLLRRQYLSDPAIVWCPQPKCDGPARGHPRGHRYQKLATCLVCDFSFCAVCLRAWHGSAAPCSFRDVNTLLKLMLAARQIEDPEERDLAIQALYLKYTRALLDRLVRDHDAEMASKEWVAKFTQKCPRCLVAVDRYSGCSHMQCSRCDAHFCYVCGVELDAGDPYLHFRVAGATCRV
ncbi:hypothetical protein BC828DRAFT_393528 [Blastocladiella britannica]|nr:hypothetical protein BC828DRAFT_393528 [Blastocladiella britannica]